MKTYPIIKNKKNRVKARKFSRSLSIALTIFICVSIMVTAAVIPWFGKIVANVNVKQPLVLGDGHGTWYPYEEFMEITIPEDAPGGERFCYKFKAWNQGSRKMNVTFEHEGLEEGIEVKVFKIPETNTLTLENKDTTTWEIINDDIQGILNYNMVGTTFDYDFTATGLKPETEYCLIYYADFDPRFDMWGGNNPGALIGTFMSDISGGINTGAMNKELGMNLPETPDWNMYPEDEYQGPPDNYEHWQCGAKIWLLPAEDYDPQECKVINWNPEEFLFETDLIAYYDCDYQLSHCPPGCENWIEEFSIDSGEQMWLLICYSFDEAIMPGQYTIQTMVVPN